MARLSTKYGSFTLIGLMTLIGIVFLCQSSLMLNVLGGIFLISVVGFVLQICGIIPRN